MDAPVWLFVKLERKGKKQTSVEGIDGIQVRGPGHATALRLPSTNSDLVASMAVASPGLDSPGKHQLPSRKVSLTSQISRI